MRQIVVPRRVIDRLETVSGIALEWVVSVDWPELRLTEEQTITNAVAHAWGLPEPHPDNTMFSIVLERFPRHNP